MIDIWYVLETTAADVASQPSSLRRQHVHDVALTFSKCGVGGVSNGDAEEAIVEMGIRYRKGRVHSQNSHF